MSRLGRHEPSFLLSHALKEIGSTGIVVEEAASKTQKTVPVDAVVLSLGYKPASPVADALADKGYPLRVMLDLRV